MNKLTRRIANTIAAAAVAGGAFLAAGGSATAAPLPAYGHTPARTTVTADIEVTNPAHGRHDSADDGPWHQFNDHNRHPHHHHHHHGSSFRYSDGYGDDWYWNAGNRFDPWIAGQLATFVHDADAS
ncbi:hypothetical protein ACWFRK_35060 [Streptomyces sp. NPDC055157]